MKRKCPKVVEPRFLIDFYDACLREPKFSKVAAIYDTSIGGLQVWMEKHPELKLAKQLADERREQKNTLAGYVFQRLSPDAREIWEEIQFWDGADSAYEKIESILSGKSVQLRQELFIHALVSNNFDVSTACRLVNLSLKQINDWRDTDMNFRALVEEIQFHKKNFFERALIGLVEQNHPGAVMFANRTLNADRGYGDKMKIEHTGQIDINHGFDIEDLELELDVKMKILDAIQRKRENLLMKQAAIDVPSKQLEYANRQ